MTKIIFILVAFLNSMARADDKFVNEFKCLKSLSLYLSEAKFIDLTPRNTMLFFLKETNEFGMYSNEMNPAVFQIEGGRIVACALQLDHKGTAKFMVNDKSGPGQAMMYTDKEKPYFRPLGVWGSTMPTIVGGAPDRNCKDVSGDTKASEMLKKIILSTLKKDMLQKNAANYIVPDYCRSSRVISQYDIEMLKRDLSTGNLQAPKQSTPNAEEPL